ncbi:LLM class F420-dependent oxidoreductase [Geodermatophilus marinus]|uniref:LLM class F420-dependent oxidoreductase n=1 Tax=Geodermatophilus sp. LHW52908 TaxID=2303986 RepID=UPI000E3DCCA7|nr:LLM class F420-dependent oxidoreductase [Geodermatophilus sp. LHW52908]RFU21497.1 LLM class F420-dependent oxidoreductase [Geodermatophilus sp. LHW52908]
MRIGMRVGYSGGFREAAEELADLEKAGLDMVSIAEAYSFDAVSQLGYLAAVTDRLELTSGILQAFTRTPTLTAMTAAGLDHVSGGRFTLGLGASGPQVVEGFHGVPYDAPLGRIREIVDICRMVWRRERVEYPGRYYTLPLPPEQGTGLGKPLKLINTPVRERIPVTLAAIGPRNVELAAEIAEGWEPIFFHPGRAAETWGAALAAGRARRDPALGPLQVLVGAPCAVGEGLEELRDAARHQLALYIGGMGARGKNFYNELTVRYGFPEAAARVQDLYLDGRKEEAAAAVPQELVDATSLVGPAGWVAERLAAMAEAGVTTVVAHLVQADREDRLRTVEQLKNLAADL